ncbi:MAG: tRNA uridine-5-carboxymethylaminomethyl(34) synthesis enzyme MnmG [Ruminococcaceae bacterium]|nr:tRNA uridine-5-carboxymethylaminomethyl(34) synthesis enzyme MnmG [Oscillospiraceae bacterium]
MSYIADSCDVVVIGGGHAGCEAALACARLNVKTYLFSISLDMIANMPCNPNIGGTAKGHLVKEIDALGGEMGKNADKTFIQSRMLNKSKGPAVHSLRVQSDRRKYQNEMKYTLEKQENLFVRQGEIIKINITGDNKVESVETDSGLIFETKAVIIATGTFLKGKIIIGDYEKESGPDGMFPANRLSESLREMGIELLRFKTGTPARVLKRSVDFSKMEVQKGDDIIVPFSFENEYIGENKGNCYLTYTNEQTHKIILDNLHRSPLYSGKIEGTGPRYCPSIEDKIVRFKDKERHQVFIEPMGLDTDEMYVQGMSSSLPEDVQEKMYRSIKGLENVIISRSAYAIEYDCVNPLELYPTLEFKKISGLYGAGQFNGTSGYEEAAAQGLIAGINAALKILNKEPFILSRDQAYIGTLIDDLVTKGTNEPYRMMTARSEYRLLLRQDNADLRLTPLGYELGLISEERYLSFLEKKSATEAEVERINSVNIPPSDEVNEFLKENLSSPITTGIGLSELLRRPELSYELLAKIDKNRPELKRVVWEEAEIQIKYEGYIRKQLNQAEQVAKLDKRLLPEGINYDEISGLRLEARQKLNLVRPKSIGQAMRISGVSPADISVLLIYLERNK